MSDCFPKRPRAGAALTVGFAAAVLAVRSLFQASGTPLRVRVVAAAGPIAATGEPATVTLRVLVAHEQHLQRVGSDTRLLSLLATLREFNAEVSLLVRTSRCNNCTRSPPTHELAHMLGSRIADATLLSSSAPPRPPAIYEFGGTTACAALLAAYPFDLILVGLWFWYDPQPCFAEVLMPIVRAHASAAAHARAPLPLVALLCDDAHAERARRLADEETEQALARAYRTQAVNFAARQRALFALTDGIFYLTAMDRDADSVVRPLQRLSIGGARTAPLHVGLLRMPMGPRAELSDPPVHESGDRAVPMIGFVGDGHTATNALGVQRFIREGWPLLRRAHPAARLRLVGRVPTGHRAGRHERLGGKNAECNTSIEEHCGWAMGTVCARRPDLCGIDTLGYLSDAELRGETARWRIMLVPIFATTGANTKLLLGLQLGLPLVSTRAAAAPFGLDTARTGWTMLTPGSAARLRASDGEQSLDESYDTGDGGDDAKGRDGKDGEDGDGMVDVQLDGTAAAAVGTTAQHLAQLTAALLANPNAAARLATNGRAHLQQLMRSMGPKEDVRALLRWVRSAARSPNELVGTGGTDGPRLDDASRPLPTADALSPHPDCTAVAAARKRTIVSSTCGLPAMWPSSWRIEAVWESLCQRCSLTCIRSTDTVHSAAGGSVVLLDGVCQLRPRRRVHGADVPHAFVHFAWDPAAARQLYHWHGGLLRHTAQSEALAAEVRRPCLPHSGVGKSMSPARMLGENDAILWCDDSLTARVNRLAGGVAWRAVWRVAFAMALGISIPVDGRVVNGTEGAMIEHLLKTVAGEHHAAFARELRAHMQRPRWPTSTDQPRIISVGRGTSRRQRTFGSTSRGEGSTIGQVSADHRAS